MATQIGLPAPNLELFEMTPEGVRKFSLSEYHGKSSVVLLFFPAVFTGVCTKEMCLVRDSMTDYQGLNAAVIGISTDLPYAQHVWKEKLELTVRLGSDHNQDAIDAYNVRYPSFAGGLTGVAKRAAFVIDRDGILIHQEILENAGELPNFEEIKSILASEKIART